MKVLLVADTHFENFADFGVPESDPEFPGCNSRCVVILRAFLSACEYGHSIGAKKMILAGDVFHRRGIINVAVFNAVSKILQLARTKYDLTVYIIFGNHDVADRNAEHAEKGHHALASLGGNAIVISSPSILAVGETSFVFLPYMVTRSEWEQTASQLVGLARTAGAGFTVPVIVAHQSFDGAVVGPHEYVMREGLHPVTSVPEAFRWVFSGHYHKHQVLGDRVVYIGGLVQHNFGERYYMPGFLVYDTDTFEWEHIENKISPRFYAIDASNEEEIKTVVEASKNRGDYVRVTLLAAVKTAELPVCANVTYHVAGETSIESRLSLVGGETTGEMLEKYVTYIEVNGGLAGISKEVLLEHGRKLLEEGFRSGVV